MGPCFRKDDNSCRPDIRHEAIELFAQTRAFAREGLGRIEHFFRRRAGFGGAAIDLHDVGGGLENLPRRPSVGCAWSTGLSRFLLESRARLPISSTDADNSSVADATDCMLLEASSEAPATWLDRLCVVSAVRVSVPAAASS